MMNGSRASHEERVTYARRGDRFVPLISGGGGRRDFDADDMTRVLDFTDIDEAPKDCVVMFCDNGLEDDSPNFPKLHLCLRGGYLFYFDPAHVDEKTGPFPTYHQPPLGVVALSNVSINFPPGGRRVFREHAQTEARSGYELVILHEDESSSGHDDFDDENGGGGGEPRPPAFLVADSLGQREKWAQALRARSRIVKPTCLRAGYAKTAHQQMLSPLSDGTTSFDAQPEQARKEFRSPVPVTSSATADRSSSPTMGSLALSPDSEKDRSATSRNKSTSSHKKGSATVNTSHDAKSLAQQVMEVSDDAELAQAVVEFGAVHFDEREWINNFFQTYNDYDAPSKCKQMEHWQMEMKKSLKGAVLEQYEYFVQASGEMTTMGREISSLKSLIETQAETLKDMKDVDFAGALHEQEGQEREDLALEQPPRIQPGMMSHDDGNAADDRSVLSEFSFGGGPGFGNGASRNGSHKKSVEAVDEEDENQDDDEDDTPSIDIPDWVEDVADDMNATLRECRYNDAIDLYNKGKAEIAELMDKHERPTAYRLKKKQLAQLDGIQKRLDGVAKKVTRRLEEALRRKNEALRQSSKRERSDAAHMTVISPCALNDDAIFLQLLVKFGKTQTAAEAYSARRSLLLLEALQERPISGAGTVDLVIYAAQMSQSFFSCLATSVEGFLDLFLSAPASHNAAAGTLKSTSHHRDDVSLDDSSLHSHAQSKNAPAGAVASIVLWCDGELAKFANAFGGTRILANLTLSPPPRDQPRKPRVVGHDDMNGTMSKDRKNAIDVASQCLDQAFMYASENLDSVGLPLTPRLADYLRPRLKGCEAEVAMLLNERWRHLTADWMLVGPHHGNGNGNA